MNNEIKASELITNRDGSIFHLHLLPEELADIVLLVGDPGRVELIASYMDIILCRKQNREFHSVTGSMNGINFTVLSTGIGPDNIDIVINELDALANIDFTTRQVRKEKRQLTLIRIGTSGAVQSDIKVGSYVISEKHIGCDGVLHFYQSNEAIRDIAFEDSFIEQTGWHKTMARPYVVNANRELVELLNRGEQCIKGVTLTAVGFYGPQGRELRLPIAMTGINERLYQFKYKEYKITNYEMESATVTALSSLLGHRATTICLIIANRITGEALPDYYPAMRGIVEHVLKQITQI